MTTESRSSDVRARVAHFESQLREAQAAAARNGFDQPAEGAVARATRVFDALAAADFAPFDVAIGVDGSIELTATIGTLAITIDVSPTGSRIDAVLDTADRVVWVGENVTPAAVVKEIERAA